MIGMSLLPEDIFTVFARLGFSKYEAQVYATLCACWRLKMLPLARYSTVPQSKVYLTVESLEEKGAVVVSRLWKTTAESVSLKQIVAARMSEYLRDAEIGRAHV